MPTSVMPQAVEHVQIATLNASAAKIVQLRTALSPLRRATRPFRFVRSILTRGGGAERADQSELTGTAQSERTGTARPRIERADLHRAAGRFSMGT